MKKLIVFLITAFIGSSAVSQENIDSLWTVWNDKSQADTMRLNAMYDIIWYDYMYTQPDSAFYFAQITYDLAESKGLKDWMAGVLNTQGVSFAIRGNYAEAVNYYTKCLRIFEEIGDKNGIATSLGNIGLNYEDQGNYTQAIDYYTKCLRIFEEIGGKNGIANALNSIGSIYFTHGDFDKANDHYTKALKIFEEIKEKYGIVNALNNIGLIHDENGDHAKAIDYYTKCLKLAEEIGYKTDITSALNNIGNSYYAQEDYAKALDYCSRALSIAQEIGTVIQTREASNSLWEINKKLGRHEAALKMYELYITMKDSIYTEENLKATIDQKYQHEYEKKIAIDEIKREKERSEERLARFGLFTISALAILIMILLIINHKNYKKQKKEEFEKLLAQLEQLKTDSLLRVVQKSEIKSKVELSEEKVNAEAHNKLNPTDLNILSLICEYPTISNKEIANEVFLSVEGVKSSLKKMYDLFEVVASAGNKKLALAITVIKISDLVPEKVN